MFLAKHEINLLPTCLALKKLISKLLDLIGPGLNAKTVLFITTVRFQTEAYQNLRNTI